jgi:hypothetical protein
MKADHRLKYCGCRLGHNSSNIGIMRSGHFLPFFDLQPCMQRPRGQQLIDFPEFSYFPIFFKFSGPSASCRSSGDVLRIESFTIENTEMRYF